MLDNAIKIFDLSGKIALITGASKGLGKAFATALAEAGATPILVARNQSELEKTGKEIAQINPQCAWYAADITKEIEVETVVKKIIDQFGKIDILVNNAATGRINLPPEETSLEQWNFVINTNLTGMFICSKAVGKEMIKRRKGKIINLASISGSIINKGVHGGSYDVSKSAIVALTRALAVEWAPYNINVNAIAPGYFLTEPNIKFFEADQNFYNQVVDMVPLKKIGDPNDLKGTVIYLASEASNFMTGSIVVVDGGYTLW